MKTERRHTLHTNALAAYLAKKFEQIKPYTNWILGGALAVVAIAFIWMIASNYFRASEDEAWIELAQASSPEFARTRIMNATQSIRAKVNEIDKTLNGEQDPEKRKPLQKQREKLQLDYQQEAEKINEELRTALINVAKDFPDAPVGWSAALRLANEDLEQGSELMFTDRDNAWLRLDEAVKRFKEVKQRARGSKYALIRQQAQLGLARAYEAKNTTDQQHLEDDDLKLAAREYEELVNQKAWCMEFAQRRLAMLREPGQGFHEWFRDAVAARPPDKLATTPAGKSGASNSAAGNGAGMEP